MVSIRARHCWRAMQAGRPKSPMLSAFQSAPAIAGGRCSATLVTHRYEPRFNPRPPLLAGDARQTLASRVAPFVSIRARHCWRAMHALPTADRRHATVSIRARHCWRAMRCPRCCCSRICRGFNPRPPLLAGDAAMLGAPLAPAVVFQSAPAIAGGRCLAKAACTVGWPVFQSAPAIAGGRCSFL